MAATLVVAACQSRYAWVKSCLASSRMACASAPATPKGMAQAATSRMTPACPPERRYRRLATTTATMIPAMTHSAYARSGSGPSRQAAWPGLGIDASGIFWSLLASVRRTWSPLSGGLRKPQSGGLRKPQSGGLRQTARW
jgi:hypothetical protein